jgi:pyruvate carboxylase subunit B
LEVTDENIFIVAACGDKGIAFLKGEAELGVRKVDAEVVPTPSPAPIPAAAAPAAAVAADTPANYSVTIDGKTHNAVVDGDHVQIGDRTFVIGEGHATEGAAPAPEAAPVAGAAPPTSAGVPVEADMPGKVLRIEAGQGTTVHDGDAVIVLEAMKMEIPVPSPVTGEVAQIHVSVGDQIAAGALLATIAAT